MGVQVHLVALGVERTGQSQSEVSDIVQGRQMRDVTVLERIAEGLGMPRELIRLAGDAAASVDPDSIPPTPANPPVAPPSAGCAADLVSRFQRAQRGYRTLSYPAERAGGGSMVA